VSTLYNLPDTLYLRLPDGIHNYCLEMTTNSTALLVKLDTEFRALLNEKYWFYQGCQGNWRCIEYFGDDQDYIMNSAQQVATVLNVPLDVA